MRQTDKLPLLQRLAMDIFVNGDLATIKKRALIWWLSVSSTSNYGSTFVKDIQFNRSEAQQVVHSQSAL